jgi:hypothetical protein
LLIVDRTTFSRSKFAQTPDDRRQTYAIAHLQFTFSCLSAHLQLTLYEKERYLSDAQDKIENSCLCVVVVFFFTHLLQFGMCRLAVTINSVICLSTFSCHTIYTYTYIRVCQILDLLHCMTNQGSYVHWA